MVKAHGSTLVPGSPIKNIKLRYCTEYSFNSFALSSILCSGTQGFSVPPLLEHGSGDEKIKYALKCEILYLIPLGAHNVFKMHICPPIPDILCFQYLFNYLERLLLQ